MDRIRAQERADRERRQAEDEAGRARREPWQAERESQERQASMGSPPAPSASLSKGDPKFQPLDPQADFVGQESRFFAKASSEADGARLNYDADGATVVYGQWAYRCVGRRWTRHADGSTWPSKS